jgi:hypothetical protein
MRVLLALLLAATACTSFDPGPCAVRCSQGRCPGSDLCGVDAYCHATAGELCAIPDAGPMPGQVLAVLDVSLGLHHACAIDVNGEVWCWGRNDRGQLGDPALGPGPQLYPRHIVVPGDGVAEQVAVGDAMSCVRKGGTVWCWGDDGREQLGSPTPFTDGRSLEPVASYHSVDYFAVDLVAGTGHVCVLADSEETLGMGSLSCWGDDGHGQASLRGGAVSQATVSQPAADSLIDQTALFGLRAGDAFTCLDFLPQAGTRQVECWGDDRQGQIDGTARVGNLAPTVAFPRMCSVLAAGGDSLACANAGIIEVRGELGQSATIETPEAVQAIALAVGLGCYQTGDGILRCWGDGTTGILGPDNQRQVGLGEAVVIDDQVDRIYAGPGYACFRGEHATRGYALLCWGQADEGRLGQGISGEVVLWPPGPVRVDSRDQAP